MPSVASTPHGDTCVKATSKLPSIGLSASGLGNARSTQADATRGQFHPAATGLSLELCGISLSPSRQAELAEENCARVLNSTPVKDAKHCLNFDESDSAIRSPEMQCKCICVREESNVYKPTLNNGQTSPVETDCSKSRPRKNVVFHSSMPVSVPQSQTDLDKFAVLTPLTQRSHKFLVCLLLLVLIFIFSVTCHMYVGLSCKLDVCLSVCLSVLLVDCDHSATKGEIATAACVSHYLHIF